MAKIEERQFEAEVGRLLDIVTNALYSDREIFLRELISNSSDACEHLRFKTLSDKSYKDVSTDFKITVEADKSANTVTVKDNGIGMDKNDLIENLGTIARSGTARIVEELEKAQKKGKKDKKEPKAGLSDMIGQFGVGFYSAFMVADKVEVLTQKVNSDQAYKWTSDGRSAYSLEEATRDEGNGTTITLYLKEDANEFAEAVRLEHIIKTYSNHISVPIAMSKGEGEAEVLNNATALWHRPESDITQEEYKNFYSHVSHGPGEPWMNFHWKVEGLFMYTALLYIPSVRPFDLYDPRREHHVKLYVKRVFVTENCEGLIPPYLRFMRGVVDSQDLPLNISREMLQNNPMVRKIRNGIVKKVLGTIETLADKDPDGFKDFVFNFGAVLKEGLYEDAEHRELLFKVVRFKSTHTDSNDANISLSDYVEHMPEHQGAIYYLTGEQAKTMRTSPHLEGFQSRGIEVLLLDDPIDEFWLTQVLEFEGKPFKSISAASDDLEAFDEGKTPEELSSETDDDSEENKKKKAANDEKTKEFEPVLEFIKNTLGSHIREVRLSHRLTSSPVCLVTDTGDLDVNMQRLLREHQHLDESFTRIMEINSDHKIIQNMKNKLTNGKPTESMRDVVWLLLDQARIMEGEGALNSADFAARLNRAIEKGLIAA